ncbi:hypothetical protein PsorP6_005658 [Peronosclerospora sorghi]|uniref:Uncharacterized protein n=1 Tax=Peronosclerospora sorghi TaxID=230839 RepID=A0ACC0W606_9STRA|nr:hypothetical protein PsorP6_005658 [Peronosclerospora sorghi]
MATGTMQIPPSRHVAAYEQHKENMTTTGAVDAKKPDAPPPKRVKTEATRTCQFCTNKKQVALNCVNLACKKCCLACSAVCATHPKASKPEQALPTQVKKPVLKNEFRERNFHYDNSLKRYIVIADYGETVTIFCVRDFFENKKLSQGVLNDQERAQRVSGNVWGRPKKKRAADSAIKELIQCALGKGQAPSHYQTIPELQVDVSRNMK